MDAAVLDALEIGCYDLGCFDTHSVLDAAVLDATVLDVTILDVANTPYEGEFGCFLGVMNVAYLLRFRMLRKLDAMLLDASILTRSDNAALRSNYTAVQRVLPPYKAIMLLSKVIMPHSEAIMPTPRSNYIALRSAESS